MEARCRHSDGRRDNDENEMCGGSGNCVTPAAQDWSFKVSDLITSYTFTSIHFMVTALETSWLDS